MPIDANGNFYFDMSDINFGNNNEPGGDKWWEEYMNTFYNTMRGGPKNTKESFEPKQETPPLDAEEKVPPTNWRIEVYANWTIKRQPVSPNIEEEVIEITITAEWMIFNTIIKHVRWQGCIPVGVQYDNARLRAMLMPQLVESIESIKYPQRFTTLVYEKPTVVFTRPAYELFKILSPYAQDSNNGTVNS